MNGLRTTAAGRSYRLMRPQYGWIYIFRINGREVLMRYLRENERGQYVIRIGEEESMKTMSPARFSYLHRFHLIKELPPRISQRTEAREEQEEEKGQTAEEIRAISSRLRDLNYGERSKCVELIGETPDELYWEIEALLDLEAIHGVDLEKRREVFGKYARIAWLLNEIEAKGSER